MVFRKNLDSRIEKEMKELELVSFQLRRMKEELFQKRLKI